jgi:hypothetical protein
VIPDAYILSRRAKVVREMPWPIPASVLMEFRDEELDELDMAKDDCTYWRTLNRAVRRIEEGSHGHELTNKSKASEE